MGAFYSNITLKGPSPNQVMQVLKEQGTDCIVSPAENDFVALFPESRYNDRGACELAAQLSAKLKCPALWISIHDDDILNYQLYDQGQPADEYNSAPGYFDPPSADFLELMGLARSAKRNARKIEELKAKLKGGKKPPSGGNAELLCNAFQQPHVQSQVDEILRDMKSYPFQTERHRALVNALGLPELTVSQGFDDLDRGLDLPAGYVRIEASAD